MKYNRDIFVSEPLGLFGTHVGQFVHLGETKNKTKIKTKKSKRR